MTKPRILVADIETAPILANVWRTWKENVGLNQIEHDWYLLSFSAKWLGAKRVIYHDQSRAKDMENDYELMLKLHRLLDEADIVVAHNGKKFDMRKINARFILNGLQPPSPYVIIDTMLEARKHFAFTSNRLVYLTDQLCTEKKSEHAQFPGFELWKQCLAGNRAAWAEMKKYNIQDTVSLEELYLKLRPWMEGHPNVAAFSNPTTPACPKCGSHNVIQKGYRHTQVSRYIRYRCNDCGGWSRGRQVVNGKAARANLLIN